MKFFKSLTWLIFLVWLMGSPVVLAQPGDSPDTNAEAMESLLKELQKSIDKTDRWSRSRWNRSRDSFIEELQSLVNRYRREIRKIFFYEDFSDGDFGNNPTWIVKSGQFRISKNGRLRSRVAAAPPSQQSSSEEGTLGIILREILDASEEKNRDEPAKQAEEDAVIQTLVKIGAAFELDLSFASGSKWGAMEVVLWGGEPATPHYRMVYNAAASQDRPIEIIRERGSRRYIIESATQFPKLDDGEPHRLQWIRDVQGQMRVLVDGEEILSTVELFYRDEFTGLALVNRGGLYEWGPIRALQAPKVSGQ